MDFNKRAMITRVWNEQKLTVSEIGNDRQTIIASISMPALEKGHFQQLGSGIFNQHIQQV